MYLSWEANTQQQQQLVAKEVVDVCLELLTASNVETESRCAQLLRRPLPVVFLGRSYGAPEAAFSPKAAGQSVRRNRTAGHLLLALNQMGYVPQLRSPPLAPRSRLQAAVQQDSVQHADHPGPRGHGAAHLQGARAQQPAAAAGQPGACENRQGAEEKALQLTSQVRQLAGTHRTPGAPLPVLSTHFKYTLLSRSTGMA